MDSIEILTTQCAERINHEIKYGITQRKAYTVGKFCDLMCKSNEIYDSEKQQCIIMNIMFSLSLIDIKNFSIINNTNFNFTFVSFKTGQKQITFINNEESCEFFNKCSHIGFIDDKSILLTKICDEMKKYTNFSNISHENIFTHAEILPNEFKRNHTCIIFKW